MIPKFDANVTSGTDSTSFQSDSIGGARIPSSTSGNIDNVQCGDAFDQKHKGCQKDFADHLSVFTQSAVAHTFIYFSPAAKNRLTNHRWPAKYMSCTVIYLSFYMYKNKFELNNNFVFKSYNFAGLGVGLWPIGFLYLQAFEIIMASL